jgi:molybdenum cofactor cytidylyltransferase
MAHPGLPGVSLPQPAVLILAAGRGERFRAAGGQSDKLDAPLTTSAGTRSVLEHVIAAAQASGLPWHVVRAQDTAHHAEQGMGTSIATGVAASADACGWLILPGDLPLVQAASLQAVAQALAQGHTVVLPEVQGQRGHPVGFGPVCREALLALRGDHGARALLQQHTVHRLALHDAGCLLDVDTPALLREAEKIGCAKAA